ncbi:MAG TPA: hypothetical protein VGM31_03345 [Puia sp.]|jgi:hypothetical protein
MKAMKSQAIAFLLGFTFTSFVLFFMPGVSKKMSQTSRHSSQKLAVVLHDSATVSR